MKGSWLKQILFALCLLVLCWMVWQAGPGLLWENLLRWNWILLACVAVWAVGYLLNAASFGLVIRSFQSDDTSRLSWSRILRLTIGGYALNYVTPFGLLGGEPWRILQLRKQMETSAANSAVTYYAMMHVLSHFLFWLIALVVGVANVNHNANGNFVGDAKQSLSNLSGLVVVIVIVLVVVSVVLLYRWAVRKGWIASLRFLVQQHPGRFFRALFLELASRLVNVAEYWLLMQVAFPNSALSTDISAFLVVAFSSLFANVLFFSPLQMGTREGGILLALQALAPSVPDLLPIAVSISFATRIREFIWIIIGLYFIKHSY